MQCCQPKQKARRKLHRKRFERIKESKWEVPLESNQTSFKYKWQVIATYSIYDISEQSELLEVYINNIKVKITRHRGIGDNAFEKKYHSWMLVESVS